MVMLDSFSGAAADLKGANRTPENVLAALRRMPRVSVWDMSEHAWLRDCIGRLERAGKIVDDKSEPYPWIRYRTTDHGGGE